MDRDPLYQKLLLGLEKVSDGDLFEKCANVLIQPLYPTLIPVPGGSDFGQDGSFLDGVNPGTLISTISPDVIGNVTKNLKQRLRNGNLGESILIATTQELSPKKCENIRKRVCEMGFRLANQPYTKTAIANLLYRNPSWTKELLGIFGEVPVLSKHPIDSYRDYDPTIAITGRDKELELLVVEKSDVIISGQPGTGKSFLCSQLTQQGLALFLVDDQLDQTVDAIRHQNPSCIIIENAPKRLGIVRRLLKLRSEIGSSFRIIAISWPSQVSALEAQLPQGTKLIDLKPLSRASIVQLVGQMGIQGPELLVAEIARQSVGNPGRAAMLTYSIRSSSSLTKFWNGQHVYQFVRSKLAERKGSQVTLQVLATIAIAGEYGIDPQRLTKLTGVSKSKLHTILSDLSYGGVIFELANGLVGVLPEALRVGLVQEFFFSGTPLIDWETMLGEASSVASAVESIVTAHCHQFPQAKEIKPLSDKTLWDLAEKYGNNHSLESLLYNSRNLTHSMLSKSSTIASDFPYPCLLHSPATTIEALLCSKQNDDRPLNANPDHPLRILEQWVSDPREGSDNIVERRRCLLNVLCKLNKTKTKLLSTRALHLVFKLGFEFNEGTAISAFTFRIGRRQATLHELEMIDPLWEVLQNEFIDESLEHWDSIVAAIKEWIYPGPPFEGHTPESRAFACKRAEKVIRTLARVPIGDAKKRELNELLISIRSTYHLKATTVFETLFPLEDPHKGDSSESDATRWMTRVRSLSKKLCKNDVRSAVRAFADAIIEGSYISHRWPDYSIPFAVELARHAECGNELLAAMIESQLSFPYVRQVIEHGKFKTKKHKDSAIERLFFDEQLCLAVIDYFVVKGELNVEYEKRILQILNAAPGTLRMHSCLTEIPERRLIRFLKEGNEELQKSLIVSIAHNHYHGESFSFRVLKATYEQGLSNGIGDFELSSLLKNNSELALDYLARLLTGMIDERKFKTPYDPIGQAAKELTDSQAHSLLRLASSSTRGSKKAIRAIVGGDCKRYAFLLGLEIPKALKQCPLRIGISQEWGRLACIALDSGMNTREVMPGFDELSFAFWGSICEKFKEEAEAWEELISFDDARISSIASLAQAEALEQLRAYTAREEKESFHEQFG